MFYFTNDSKIYSLERSEDFWEVYSSIDPEKAHSYKSLSAALRYLLTVVVLSDHALLNEMIDSGDSELLFLEVGELLSYLNKSPKSKSNLKRDHRDIFDKANKIGNKNILSILKVKELINE